MKLSTKEHLVLLFLHTSTTEITTDAVPPEYFGDQECTNLVQYGLLEQLEDESYILTEKAHKVINDKAFIVVYPPTTKEGKAATYNEVQESMSRSAKNAWVLAMISTDFEKGVGKFAILKLYEKLKNSRSYFLSKQAPHQKLFELKGDVLSSQDTFQKELQNEFTKIDNFTLREPINFGDYTMIKILDHTKAVFTKDGIEKVHDITKGEFSLSVEQKLELIRFNYVFNKREEPAANSRVYSTDFITK